MDPLYRFYVDAVKGTSTKPVDRIVLEEAFHHYMVMGSESYNYKGLHWLTRDIFNPAVVDLTTDGLPKFRFEYRFREANIRYIDGPLKSVYLTKFSPYEAYLLNGKPIPIYKIINLVRSGTVWEEVSHGDKYIVIPVYDANWEDGSKEKTAFPVPYDNRDICVLTLASNVYSNVELENEVGLNGVTGKFIPPGLIEILYMYEESSYRSRYKNLQDIVSDYSMGTTPTFWGTRYLPTFSYKGQTHSYTGTEARDFLLRNANIGETDCTEVNLPKGCLTITAPDYSLQSFKPHKIYTEAGLMPMVKGFLYIVNGCILCPHMYESTELNGWIKVKDGPWGGYLYDVTVLYPMRLKDNLYQGETPTIKEAYEAQCTVARTLVDMQMNFLRISPVLLDETGFEYTVEYYNQKISPLNLQGFYPSLESLIWYHSQLKQLDYGKRFKVHHVWGDFRAPFTDEVLQQIESAYQDILSTTWVDKDSPIGRYDHLAGFLVSALEEYKKKASQEDKTAYLNYLAESFKYLSVKELDIGKDDDKRLLLPYGRLNTARYNGKSKYFTYDL